MKIRKFLMRLGMNFIKSTRKNFPQFSPTDKQYDDEVEKIIRKGYLLAWLKG
jgi:hypothetical protein